MKNEGAGSGNIKSVSREIGQTNLSLEIVARNGTADRNMLFEIIYAAVIKLFISSLHSSI